MFLFYLWKHNFRNMFRDGKNAVLLSTLMLTQNLLYFLVWVLFFSRVSSLRGWGLTEMTYLWAMTATGYGLTQVLFGGVSDISRMISEGELDSFLARPKSLLLQITARHHRVDGLGDIATGFIALGLFAVPPASAVPFIILFTLTTAVIIFGIFLAIQSLAFWGAGKGLSDNIFSAWLIVANNPQNGFPQLAKLFLLIGFPTLYLGYLPVEILHSFRWDYLFLQLIGSIGILLLGLTLFNRGLKRYTSGSQFTQMR